MREPTLRVILNHIKKGRGIKLEWNEQIVISGLSEKGHPFHIDLAYDYCQQDGRLQTEKAIYLLYGPLIPLPTPLSFKDGVFQSSMISPENAINIIEPHFTKTHIAGKFHLGLDFCGFNLEMGKFNYDAVSFNCVEDVTRRIERPYRNDRVKPISKAYFFG